MTKFFIKSGILISFLAFLAYFNTLNGFFISDDYGPLGFIRNASFIEIIKGNLPAKGSIFIRPVADFLWKMDYSIFHFNPVGYHITNTVIHALNSILVALLAFILIKDKLIGLFAGILFSLHPIHPEAVVWIAARYDLLCTFFYLLSLATFIIYCNIFKNPYLYFISIIAYPIGLLSKEMAITLPLILLLWRFIFKDTQRLKLYIPHFITTFIYLSWRFIYIGDMGGYRDFEGRPLFLQFHFITFLKRVFYNIPFNLILPMNREVIAKPIRMPIAILFFIGIVTALYLNHKYIYKRPLLFGAGLIMANILLIHHIAGVSPDLQGARLMYLPSVGFCIIFANLLLGENNRKNVLKKINLTIISIFCLLYMILTFYNNRPWNIAGRITGQIPKIAKEYALKYSGEIKLYFLIPDTIKGAYPYGHCIPETIAPLFYPLKPENISVINDINHGDTGEYLFYAFDLRNHDFYKELGKQNFFFRWNETTGRLEDISLALRPKIDNFKPKQILPQTRRLSGAVFSVKDMHIPVISIGGIELKIKFKSAGYFKDKIEIFWISDQDKKWDFKKHIFSPVEIDGEFRTYHIPFYLFNPDWLGEVYLEELKLELNTRHKLQLQIEYVKLLPYQDA